jgi:outer membrane protein TolC
MLLLISLIAGNARSQTVLETYIKEGLAANLQLRQEQLHYEKSVAGLAIAKSLFMPQVGINASYTLADGGRKIQFPIGDLLNPVYTTLNQLTNTNNFPSVNNENIQFLPNHFHDTKLRVIQPLFNPDIYFNYKAQKELITVQQAQKNTYENELKFSIAAAYFQYLQSMEALQILEHSRETLLELVKVNQRLVANQKATRDVVLTAEYELNKVEQQLAEANKNLDVTRAYFNFLLNRDLSAPIIRDSTLIAGGDVSESLSDLKSTALAQRQEVKQVQSGLLASGNVLALNRNTALLPKLNVVGDIGYQGFEYKFDGDQQYWLVQFSLSWDLFKGGERKARTQQARLDYQVAENKLEQLKKQIELQVIQSYQERAAAQQAYTTSTSGVVSAEKNLQIIRARYMEGQALLIEYIDAQNKFSTAQLVEKIRLFDLLRSEAALQKTVAAL